MHLVVGCRESDGRGEKPDRVRDRRANSRQRRGLSGKKERTVKSRLTRKECDSVEGGRGWPEKGRGRGSDGLGEVDDDGWKGRERNGLCDGGSGWVGRRARVVGRARCKVQGVRDQARNEGAREAEGRRK